MWHRSATDTAKWLVPLLVVVAMLATAEAMLSASARDDVISADTETMGEDRTQRGSR